MQQCERATRLTPSTQSNVTYAVPFGVVRVGIDESNAGFDDVWLQQPGAPTPTFQRGWEQRPREVSDWVHAEGFTGKHAGVTISSSVGAWDWVDPTGAYPATQPVLAPEVRTAEDARMRAKSYMLLLEVQMLVHTNSNKGPFLPEVSTSDRCVIYV